MWPNVGQIKAEILAKFARPESNDVGPETDCRCLQLRELGRGFDPLGDV